VLLTCDDDVLFVKSAVKAGLKVQAVGSTGVVWIGCVRSWMMLNMYSAKADQVWRSGRA